MLAQSHRSRSRKRPAAATPEQTPGSVLLPRVTRRAGASIFAPHFHLCLQVECLLAERSEGQYQLIGALKTDYFTANRWRRSPLVQSHIPADSEVAAVRSRADAFRNGTRLRRRAWRKRFGLVWIKVRGQQGIIDCVRNGIVIRQCGTAPCASDGACCAANRDGCHLYSLACRMIDHPINRVCTPEPKKGEQKHKQQGQDHSEFGDFRRRV